MAIPSDTLAQTVRLNLPEVSEIPEGSVGPWLGVGEQWTDFYDVIIGETDYFTESLDLISPDLQDRSDFYDRLLMESAPVADLPNHVAKIDFSWHSLEGGAPDEFRYARTDFAVEFVLRQVGSQVVGVLGTPIPDWVQPFLYDADSGTTLTEYRIENVRSNDGVVRSGEDRLDAWERYVAAAVTRYRDFVEIWTILNEPVTFLFSEKAFLDSGLAPDRAQANAKQFGTLFDEFTYELIKRASRVIRELDPTAKIAALGLLDLLNDPGGGEFPQSSYLLDRLLQHGIQNEVDMISLHLFPRQMPGDVTVDPDEQGEPDFVNNRTPEGEAISLDRFSNPAPALRMVDGTDLKLMIDEWGHVTMDRFDEQVFPHFMIRLLAQNLAGGVSPLLAFEAYDYLLFTRDVMQDVDDFYFLKSNYPGPPTKTPGFEALKEIIRFFSGAVAETQVNETAPNAAGLEYPDVYLAYGFSFRSFTNGLDRIVALWSNSLEPIDLLITTAQEVQAKIVVFRRDGSVEVHENTTESSVFSLSLLGVDPLQPFESVILYLSANPDAEIELIVPNTEVVAGTSMQLHAQGPMGERLAPSWRVIQGTGLGVISPDGVFRGLRNGTVTAVADVGVHQASCELRIVDLSNNLIGNGGLDQIWTGDGGSVFDAWKVFPPASKAADAGAWLNIVADDERFMGNASAKLHYQPEIGVDVDPVLTRDWWPGTINQTLVSGLSALGPTPWDEPLLFFCWARRPQGSNSKRYAYLHLALFDRYRNPQGSKAVPVRDRHKLADVRIGGKCAPGEEWTLVSSLDKVGVPYAAEDPRKTEFISNGLIQLPSDVEQIDVILEVDNRFESDPTTVQIDGLYLGPYQPLILMHSKGADVGVDLAWFFDQYANSVTGTSIDLYLDTDLQPGNGNEWLINQARILPAICEAPVRLRLAEIPEQMRSQRPLFAYAKAVRFGTHIATDYTGPLPLAVPDGEPPAPTPVDTPTTTPEQTPVETPTPPPVSGVEGDANNNDRLDIGDAMAITQYLGGIRENVPGPAMADLNGNGIIDIGDALYITQILAGLRLDPNE